jgi:hypothetical protein
MKELNQMLAKNQNHATHIITDGIGIFLITVIGTKKYLVNR